MKRNVYFVDLGTGSNRNLLPLGSGLISAYSASIPTLNEACSFNIHFLRGDNAEIANGFEDPFVVGFACYVWNLKASLRLAAVVKQHHPAARIVFGGYSVPKEPQRIAEFFELHPYVDVLIHGEGEHTFADMLGALVEDRELVGVRGLTFRTPDVAAGFVTTERRERIANLDEIPSPFLNGSFDRVMARYGQHVTGAVWETNRGCPFACTFCDWGNADVNKVKQFDMARLEAEIDWLSRNKIYYIYLADANFGIFYDRDLELAGKLADRCSSSGYPKFIAMNWTKNSHERIVTIADRLAAGGIVTSVTLAMQSFNPSTLAAIKRRNIKHDSLIKLKKEFHDRDLPTYTEMILGLPEEDYTTFQYGLNKAMTSRLADHWVFHLCTLLENTEMWTGAYRERYGIESRTCSAGISRRAFDQSEESETEELVVGTRTMPIPEWQRSYALGYMSAALYNFRVAFFPMNYIQQELGTDHTAFIEHVIETVTARPEGYPNIARALSHVRKQNAMILDGVACLSSIPELGGNMALPHEAILSIMLDDPDQLYRDLAALVGSFLAAHDHVVDESLVQDIVTYQRARMPIWEKPVGRSTIDFTYNVPQYFAALTAGLPVPALERVPSRATFIVEPTKAKDKFAFNGMRTRSGHTIELLKVETDMPALRGRKELASNVSAVA
ncbi:MAG: radical SAM protein [Alphaproteobacteria bacterium]|nr:radical SAM protein [Alphaproteobacteria bacterium]